MSARAKVALKIVFVLAIFALLAFFLDFRQFARELSRISIFVVILCLAGELLFYFIESIKVLFLAGFKYSFALILRCRLLSAFLANFAPGLILGDILRIFMMDRARPGNKVFVTSVLVSSRIYGILPLVIILPVFALFHPAVVERVGTPALLLGILGGLIIWMSPLFIRYAWARRILFSVYLVFKAKAVRRILRKVYLAFNSFGSVQNWLVASVTSLATFLIVIAEFWAISTSLGLGVSFTEWALLVSVVSIATFLPLGIGAFGSQDAVLALLAPYFGQSIESFVALSVLIHVVRILGTLPGTFFLGEGIGALRALRLRTPQS